MSISDTTENAIMNLIFRAVNWSLYADNTATTPQTNIAVSLQTADPLDAGTMATSEATYTGYARQSVARTTGGWTASANGTISPAANIDFPTGTAGSGTVSFFTTGATGGGATAILWSGGVSPAIVTGNGVLPRLTTSTTISVD